MSANNHPVIARKARRGQIIPFDPALRAAKDQPTCIFCGQTLGVQTFKGKKVCASCLRDIPSMFSYG